MPEKTQEILTPTDVANRIKCCLKSEIGPVAVTGELSGVRRPSSGHTYFSLKDKSGGVLDGVVWRSRRGPKSQVPDELLADGLEVLAYGDLTVYAPRSAYQIDCKRLEPRGEGALRRAYELLKAKLEREGLFREDRKRPLPLFPGRVALLTAKTGAGVGDFTGTALRRFPGARISLFTVLVQGEGAAAEMAAAIEAVNGWGGFDVIVLTRGGGSAADLWAFNEEALVRAVAASRVPVLAAVGHSRDLSLTELAADRRAITPTAAAEAVFPDARAAADEALRMAERMGRAVRDRLAGRRAALEDLSRRASELFQRRLAGHRSALGRLQESLAASARRAAQAARGAAETFRLRLMTAMAMTAKDARSSLERLEGQLRLLSPDRRLSLARRELQERATALRGLRERLLTPFRTALEHSEAALRLLSPLAVLSRGYSIATDSQGRIIRKAADIEPGDAFRLQLGEGALAAEVTAREKG
ncbi:MAG: exodeoxyribonuclease VII large subunit [Deltaproteobacteria bacterium]|jgi:exodeoxyribonuclease VII large subunit|nr:exodeoxyribonuclease VII large subunit [Deltaproteobacteria bacterium]